jgi:hypothetical protein
MRSNFVTNPISEDYKYVGNSESHAHREYAPLHRTEPKKISTMPSLYTLLRWGDITTDISVIMNKGSI